MFCEVCEAPHHQVQGTRHKAQFSVAAGGRKKEVCSYVRVSRLGSPSSHVRFDDVRRLDIHSQVWEAFENCGDATTTSNVCNKGLNSIY